MNRKVNSVLISVYNKEGLDDLLDLFLVANTKIISTGGTWEFLKERGLNPVKVEDLTSYPGMLDGRVKTLHPAIFGGILAIRNEEHLSQLEKYQIPTIDMVIVDLYPFEETVNTTNDDVAIIEKIDIGGLSLIRAAAKNHKDVLVVPSKNYYSDACKILKENSLETDYEQRRKFAGYAFKVSMNYETAISNYFSDSNDWHAITNQRTGLRYGENSHQEAYFEGNLDEIFEKLNGKELSYNNLVDIDAALQLYYDIDIESPFCAVIKHTNPCGAALGKDSLDAWHKAYASDPESAFGGIIILNNKIDKITAEEIDKIFYEILIAPDFDIDALKILKKKKNRILLKLKYFKQNEKIIKTLLNGKIIQSSDNINFSEFKITTNSNPNAKETEDLKFANIIVKHLKSNAIALVKNQQLIGIGNGQTSRVNACKQSIEKARRFDFDLKNAVLASDAFFPFNDSVELAYEAGIRAIIQPGGSINDDSCIEYCNKNGICMVITGTRHFRH